MIAQRYTPGEIDANLPVSEIIDIETQNLFDLQHHYASSNWHQPAPTEGEVYAGGASETYPYSLGDLAVFGEIIKGTPGHHFDRFPAYGLRTGLLTPSTPAKVYETERTIKQAAVPDVVPVIEAGIGRSTWSRIARRGLHKVTLRREGDPADPDWTVRLYDQTGPEPELIKVKAAPDDETMKQFLQIFRVVVWNSVSEPI